MVTGTKLIQRPIREESLRWLMHFKVYLIPDRMMNGYNEHEHASTYERKEGQNYRDWQPLNETLPEI